MNSEKDMSPVNKTGESLSAAARLEDWLTNTFWFHYKWYFIIGVFALSLIIMAIVGLASSVSYDWTVVYAHSGTEDSAKAAEIQQLFEDILPETGKNRRVDVKLIELADNGSHMSEYGEHRLYGHLNDQNIMLFILDESTCSEFVKLGYFEDAAKINELGGLYCASNDAPVARLSAEDSQYEDYSQEFLDDVYLEYVDEHNAQLAAVREILSQLN